MKLSPRKEVFRFGLGDRGEVQAWGFLIKQGYKIIEKNYRCKIGEIDVICKKDGRLIFVEVKTRQSSRFGSPEEAVSKQKQNKIARVAEWYLKENKLPVSKTGFAVVAVKHYGGAEPEIRLIKDAFSLESLENENRF
jgi:putative endonuclease